jgi:hypothetical protein
MVCGSEVANHNPAIWLAVLGWAIIVIGWLYNNNQSNMRENRKELRSSLDNIINEIDDVHKKAIEYYTKSPKDSGELAFHIKVSQARLISKVERLSKLHEGHFKAMPLVHFMDVITGGDFEEKKRKIRKYSDTSDNLLIDISYSADSLIGILESDFCEIVKKVPKKKQVIYQN